MDSVETTHPQPAHHGVPRVLIVDDEIEHAEICAALLRRRGYKVAVAVNGADAVELVHVLKPDVILLDLMMPAQDGFTTAASLQRHPDTKNVPIIFLSACSDPSSWTRAGELGAASFLPKPFRAAELVACVEQSLARPPSGQR
jgi:DNA-binding response OmpR family regulator